MRTYTLGTIREFCTKQFRVIVDAIEDNDLDTSFDETGEVNEKLASGEYVGFCARVRVLYNGEEVGADYLGGCIYSSIEEFMDHKECGRQNKLYAEQGKQGRCGSYFTAMVHTAIAEARKTLAHRPYIRLSAIR